MAYGSLRKLNLRDGATKYSLEITHEEPIHESHDFMSRLSAISARA